MNFFWQIKEVIQLSVREQKNINERHELCYDTWLEQLEGYVSNAGDLAIWEQQVDFNTEFMIEQRESNRA